MRENGIRRKQANSAQGFSTMLCTAFINQCDDCTAFYTILCRTFAEHYTVRAAIYIFSSEHFSLIAMKAVTNIHFKICHIIFCAVRFPSFFFFSPCRLWLRFSLERSKKYMPNIKTTICVCYTFIFEHGMQLFNCVRCVCVCVCCARPGVRACVERGSTAKKKWCLVCYFLGNMQN